MTEAVKEKIRARWNGMAETFDQCPGHGVQSACEEQEWKAVLIQELGEQPLKILDVGTGTGFLAMLLAEMGHTVTGVDIADNMLHQAIRKAADKNFLIDFQTGDAEQLPFADGMFDAVVNRHVFWTMPQPEKAASEWLRVIKPGGRLVIIDGDWNRFSAWKTLWKMIAFLGLRLSGHNKGVLKKARGLQDFEKNLPLSRKKRPAADLEIFRKFGLPATAKFFRNPRAAGFMASLVHGYYQRFVVTVVKPPV